MTAIVTQGDAMHLALPDESVDLIVTSPPYFGLRSYQDGGEHYEGQIGDEATPAEYVAALMACTAEWMRVLKPSGSLFVNLGDKYSTYESRPEAPQQGHKWAAKSQRHNRYVKSAPAVYGVPYKSLMMLPQRYGIACIEAGWSIRQELIWSKNSAMPTRLTDRARRTHEHLFHIVKSQRYYAAMRDLSGYLELDSFPPSVWNIAPVPFTAPAELGVDHHAAFPPELPLRCVLGWSPAGGVVLDPFGGTGTTALVASVHGRVGISNDLSADYCRLARWRTTDPGQRAKAAGIKVERKTRRIVLADTAQQSLFDAEGWTA